MKSSIIKKYSKKSRLTEDFISRKWDEIKNNLISNGLKEEEKRFYPYLTTLLRKELEIKEQSVILLRFKEFLKEKNEA